MNFPNTSIFENWTLHGYFYRVHLHVHTQPKLHIFDYKDNWYINVLEMHFSILNFSMLETSHKNTPWKCSILNNRNDCGSHKKFWTIIVVHKIHRLVVTGFVFHKKRNRLGWIHASNYGDTSLVGHNLTLHVHTSKQNFPTPKHKTFWKLLEIYLSWWKLFWGLLSKMTQKQDKKRF